jgi:hypothetical protein
MKGLAPSIISSRIADTNAFCILNEILAGANRVHNGPDQVAGYILMISE